MRLDIFPSLTRRLLSDTVRRRRVRLVYLLSDGQSIWHKEGEEKETANEKEEESRHRLHSKSKFGIFTHECEDLAEAVSTR